MDENMTVKNQIIAEFVKSLIEGCANDVADSEDEAELTKDELNEVIDEIIRDYCEGKNLAEIDRELFFEGRVAESVAAKTRDILEARARVFTIPIKVTYEIEITVKAKDKDEAVEYAGNLDSRDIGEFVDSDCPEEWEVDEYSVTDEGSAEEYGDADFDATDD